MSRPSSVLVVGAGGLGCPALIELAAGGIERLGILEPDRVELTNLHRQILYREADVGIPKAEVAGRAIRARWPDVTVETFAEAFGPSTQHLLARYDAVLDGTDRFETKLLLADACVDLGLPFVFGGVIAHEAQVLGVLPGRSACPRCLFDEGPPPGTEATCAELGILGPIAGIAAARQVEVLWSLFGSAPLVDVLSVYDGRSDVTREVRLRKAPDCQGCGAARTRRGALVPPAETDPGAEAEILDLTGLVCPATFVATRRALDPLSAGDHLWLRLAGDEAKRNVPASVRAAGHRILAQKTDGRVTTLLIERGTDSKGTPS